LVVEECRALDRQFCDQFGRDKWFSIVEVAAGGRQSANLVQHNASDDEQFAKQVAQLVLPGNSDGFIKQLTRAFVFQGIPFCGAGGAEGKAECRGITAPAGLEDQTSSLGPEGLRVADRVSIRCFQTYQKVFIGICHGKCREFRVTVVSPTRGAMHNANSGELRTA
jgi:hypothetical protein